MRFKRKFFFFPLFVCLLCLSSSSLAIAKDGFLQTEDGVRLFYDYDKASNQKGAVVLLHGWGMSYNEWIDFKKFLLKNNWSAIAIDFRGHGASIEQGKKALDYQTFTEKDKGRMLKDVAAASHYLGTVRPIWIIGSSFGAGLAFTYARQKQGIKGVVLISPALKYSEAEYQIAMNQYGDRPILLAASADDPKWFAVAGKLRKYANGKAKFIQYKTAGHGMGLFAHDPTLKKDILDWLNSSG